jgi:hypothetical protein
MKTPKTKIPAYKPPKRFAVGTPVRVINPGVDGVVLQVDDERTVMSQYWHTVQTKFGERREPGSILELIPPPMGLPTPRTGKVAENIHFHGHNSRLNVNSADHSANTVSVSKDQVFVELREKAHTIIDEQTRIDVLERIDALDNAKGTGGFLSAYQAFMSIASDHITVFAPLLPALAQLLS